MRLSYSAISTYQKCPLSYKYGYVDKLPGKPSHYLSFGNSIHSALEWFYKVEPGAKPYSLEQLLQELDNVWIGEAYNDERHEAEYKEKGRKILTLFYRENLATFAAPEAVERRFAEPVIDGITLSGVIDRVDRLPNGHLEIIDYKTNDKLPPVTKIRNDLQLPIYHMAVERIYGEAPEKVSLYFLVPGKKISQSKSKAEIEQAKRAIAKVAENIRAESFGPVKNPLCPWCDYLEHCLADYADVHKGDKQLLVKARANGKLSTQNGQSGKPVQVSLPVQSAAKVMQRSASEIEKAVDEYVELLKTISGARTRLSELQPVIHNYCEANGLTSVNGTSGKLGRKAHKTTHYNVDKLRALLEPQGLWDKVLDVNGRLLRDLLDEAPAGGDLRALIETAKEIEEISYALYVKDEPAQDE